MEFLKVPGGTYRIGTTWDGVINCVKQWKRHLGSLHDERTFRDWIEKEFPDHRVECDSFDMSRTLVSHGDIRRFILQTGAPLPFSLRDNSDDAQPVWGASAEWANQFALWLSHQDPNYDFRLPTETEWEIAARGPDFREYPYGGEFRPDAANTLESGLGRPTPVEHHAATPGPFGHLDLAGNVEEWVSTKYYVYPGGQVIHDDLYQLFGMNYRILRGGSFAREGDYSRAARRHGPFPDSRHRYTGFRLIRAAKSVNGG